NTSAGASVVDANGVQLGASNVASLKVVANQGAITQAEAITVSGSTSLDAGGNAITLTKANDFGGKVNVKGGATAITSSKALDANLNTTGATTLVAGTELGVAGNVSGGTLSLTTVKGTINATTVEKDLSLTATGGVTQKGALKVGGVTSIKSSGGSVDLTDAGNDFVGKVSIDGSASVVDANALAVELSGKGDVSVAAGGVLDISGVANNVNTSAVGKTNFGDLNVAQKLNIVSLGGELFVLDGKLLLANEIDFTLPKNVNLGSYANQFHIESAENILVLSGGNGYIQIPVTSKARRFVGTRLLMLIRSKWRWVLVASPSTIALASTVVR
ncbi:MAG: hypothetical protein HYZ45_06940, partial [Burkholderiales bacterium]|nr:hypothetical protein [Burkholderiales bacterium]